MQREQLIEADAAPTVAHAPDQGGIGDKRLRTRIHDGKIIAETVHLGERKAHPRGDAVAAAAGLLGRALVAAGAGAETGTARCVRGSAPGRTNGPLLPQALNPSAASNPSNASRRRREFMRAV